MAERFEARGLNVDPDAPTDATSSLVRTSNVLLRNRSNGATGVLETRSFDLTSEAKKLQMHFDNGPSGAKIILSLRSRKLLDRLEIDFNGPDDEIVTYIIHER